MSEVLLIDDTGRVTQSGEIEWNDDDDEVDIDIDASSTLRAEVWCAGCEALELEPEEPIEIGDRVFLSRTFVVQCGSCRQRAPSIAVVDEMKVEIRNLNP